MSRRTSPCFSLQVDIGDTMQTFVALTIHLAVGMARPFEMDKSS